MDRNAYRHMKHPVGFGTLEGATATGHAGSVNRVGPFFEVYLVVENDIIRRFGFETYRCPWSMATGSALFQLVVGKSLKDASSVDLEQMGDMLGEVPPGKVECLTRGLAALKNAIAASVIGQR